MGFQTEKIWIKVDIEKFKVAKISISVGPLLGRMVISKLGQFFAIFIFWLTVRKTNQHADS